MGVESCEPEASERCVVPVDVRSRRSSCPKQVATGCLVECVAAERTHLLDVVVREGSMHETRIVKVLLSQAAD